MRLKSKSFFNWSQRLKWFAGVEIGLSGRSASKHLVDFGFNLRSQFVKQFKCSKTVGQLFCVSSSDDGSRSVLVFEDLFIAIYMAVLSLLLVSGDTGDFGQILSSIAVLLLFIVGLVLFVYLGGKFFEHNNEIDYQNKNTNG